LVLGLPSSLLAEEFDFTHSAQGMRKGLAFAARQFAAACCGARIVKITMLTSDDPKQNRLLAELPAACFKRLLRQLDLIPLGVDWTVYDCNSPQEYVYFPTSGIVSLLYAMEDGSSVEIAVVGNEGVVGIALFMGGETIPHRAVVQSAGYAWRLRSHALKEEFNRGEKMQHLLLRYTQSMITQTAQTVASNRHHSVEQQLSRWLLLRLDRLSSNELALTYELIANMMGVRRQSVVEAAGKLQAAGLINHRRGRITVLDRPQLEARVYVGRTLI
jgi:CRP-like cAMP-binding protein